MDPKEIKTLLYKTQKLMYGFNYEVTLGMEIFDNCVSLPDVNRAIIKDFPKTNFENVTPVTVPEKDFWNDVHEKFDYRGEGVGTYLKLNVKQEIELKRRQNKISRFISQYINKDTVIYSYQFLEGIPGYPVYWEYAFVILNTSGQSLFFYGSSSD